MLLIDMAMRGAAIGLLMLLAGLFWRTPIGWEGRISILAVAAAKSAFLLVRTAVPLDLPPLLETNLILLASLTPNAITWLILTIFVDPPGQRWPWFVASSGVSLLLYLQMTAPHLVPVLGCTLPAAALYAALLVLALWSARDDLVDCRCRARPGFAVAIAGLALVSTGGQGLDLLQQDSLSLALLQSGGTLAVTLAFAVWILSPELDRWPGEQATRARPAPAAAPSSPDAALIARVKACMEEGIWREEGLTIGALAARLNVPEHRLRRAINGGLGHRNFSNFVNGHRIAEAKAQLADPEAEGTTVLEIAYDVGFASLGPFNRAFRAETDLSPTEYRRMALGGGDALADSETGAPIPANTH